MPIKHLAAIDIGTNSFHLIIVKVNENGNFEIVGREKEVIRLGEGNQGDIKFLNNAAMERAVNTLSTFKGIAESYNAEILAVATSAVRESENQNVFIKMVSDATGIVINVISGYEEARLIYLGILKAVPVFDERILCIDIGGGSTEFLVGERGDIIYSNSLKLGAVRLTQKFFPEGVVTKLGIEQCRDWVEGEIYPVIKSIDHLNFKYVVGSSGTIQAAALIHAAKNKDDNYKPEILNNFTFSDKDLLKVEKIILSKKSTDERKKISGLEIKRADIIPAGIIILSTIVRKLKIKEITVSGYALREGIILDSVQKSSGGKYHDYLHNIRMKSVEQLAGQSNYDYNHCKHVAELSVGMFDQLQSLHNLGEEYREYLYVAAVLHDIGYHISHNLHHKHSYYLIRHSNLLGFTDMEISLIANVARYHRKSHPKNSHQEFINLPANIQLGIKKLASILRVADALDRSHSSVIKSINSRVVTGKVILDLENSDQTINIELWSLERRKGLFEETFETKLMVN